MIEKIKLNWLRLRGRIRGLDTANPQFVLWFCLVLILINVVFMFWVSILHSRDIELVHADIARVSKHPIFIANKDIIPEIDYDILAAKLKILNDSDPSRNSGSTIEVDVMTEKEARIIASGVFKYYWRNANKINKSLPNWNAINY